MKTKYELLLDKRLREMTMDLGGPGSGNKVSASENEKREIDDVAADSLEKWVNYG